MALWEVNQNQQPVNNSKPQRRGESSQGGIFGVEPANQVPSSKQASRRNEATFSFGDYNYFKEENQK